MSQVSVVVVTTLTNNKVKQTRGGKNISTTQHFAAADTFERFAKYEFQFKIIAQDTRQLATCSNECIKYTYLYTYIHIYIAICICCNCNAFNANLGSYVIAISVALAVVAVAAAFGDTRYSLC